MGDVGTKNYSDATDRSGKINRPTSGNWDGRQHIGEALGRRHGRLRQRASAAARPYRLDGDSTRRASSTVAGAPDVAGAAASRPTQARSSAQTPKRIKFVLDISGSMYTFNRIDDRLRRLQEAAVFILEAFARAAQESEIPNFKGSYLGRAGEAKYDLTVVGHRAQAPGRAPSSSARGDGRRALPSPAGSRRTPSSPTPATRRSSGASMIDDAAAGDADERFVFVVSDADLKRYGITPGAWNAILMARHGGQAYVVLISSNEDEAAAIVRGLAPGPRSSPTRPSASP
ncbi:ATPase [Aureococcus anophagefferens]|nr:ATPase [Aureococcus anophagefferens]